MKLKKIILENIRSYEKEEINFPEGSTLLSGDIGSGKTSVLLGIEFALFGLQPGQRGSALLRNGQEKGGVTIFIDVDGREVVIERTLKRGKSISQDYCAITIDGEKREFSVTELKDKVLDILSYPKEFSKKQNILYKFTVYTPQEEMKQIILEDPESRVNTLRHVFGIDKYKKILENVSILASKLREEKRLREGMIQGLEEDKASLVSKEEELEAKHYNLVSVEKELFSKTESRKKIQEEKEEVSEKIEERKKLKQEIEKTKILISTKNESLLTNLKLVENLNEQINEFSDLKFDPDSAKEIEQSIDLKRKEKDRFNEENLRITSQIHSLTLKNEENDNLRERLRHLEICPTCLQNVDAVYRGNVLNKLDSNTSANINNIKELTEEKKQVFNKIESIRTEISEMEKKIQEINIVKIQIREIEDKRKRLEELKKSNQMFEADISLLKQQQDSLNQSVFDLKKFENIFETKEKELENSMREERAADIKVAELKKEIEVFSRQIEELKARIAKTEIIKENLNKITKLETWLSKNFIPLVSLVEKNVMIKLKTQFSELFARWFSMLVSDTFDVRLDDNFTPVIEHQDYEIDYAYLSGGERTAVALAYRLSLNQVVNSLMSKIKTRDLVILDEPTDGFSEQQLDKMRDVLRQLDIKQLIIVSHEQKIESFVENVIKFRKEHGVSKKVSENFIK